MHSQGEGSLSKREQALAYAKHGRPVLPLKGKVPLTKHGYKDATLDEAQIRKWWKANPDANVGILTGKQSRWCVLDIDIKKGKRGDESLRLLEEEYGPLPKTLQAETPSGGFHYVFRIDVPLKSQIGLREGIDLLGDQSYFVAAPSVINGKHYRWINDVEVAPCPDWLIQLGKEDMTQEGRIAKIVKEILPLGKERKGNWRVRCPFLTHTDTTPSFDVRLSDGVFNCFGCPQSGRIEELYAHIKHVTVEEARRIIFPPPEYVNDLNKIHAVITDFAGKCVIMNESRDPVSGWLKITFSALADLKGRYRSRKKELVGKTYTPLADAWFGHRDRREFCEIIFLPGRPTPPGYYNLWQGFSVTPRPGDCHLYLRLIHDVICSRSTELYEYVLSWMALAVQRPWQRPEAALVLRGNEGVGKGTFCSHFGKLFGPHYKHLNSTRQLVGNFNAHLANAVVVFADEALWAGDKPNQGVLKALITEKTMPLEYKGKDIVLVENHIHLVISTNNDWAVPAGPRARRFCVMDVSEEHIQDHDYFGLIEYEMENGGREAFFHELLNRNIEHFNPRKIPVTEALNEMKKRTIAGTPAEFWNSLLERGTLDPYDSEWNPQVTKERLHEDYCAFFRSVPHKSTQTQLGMALKKLCPHVKDCRIPMSIGKGTRMGWDFGDLKKCRDAFCRFFNYRNDIWDIAEEPASNTPAHSRCEVHKGPAVETP